MKIASAHSSLAGAQLSSQTRRRGCAQHVQRPAICAARDIRLVATDVDGTLLNSKQELTPRVKAAVNAAVKKGIPVSSLIESAPRLQALCNIETLRFTAASRTSYRAGHFDLTASRSWWRQASRGDPGPRRCCRSLARRCQESSCRCPHTVRISMSPPQIMRGRAEEKSAGVPEHTHDGPNCPCPCS